MGPVSKRRLAGRKNYLKKLERKRMGLLASSVVKVEGGGGEYEEEIEYKVEVKEEERQEEEIFEVEDDPLGGNAMEGQSRSCTGTSATTDGKNNRFDITVCLLCFKQAPESIITQWRKDCLSLSGKEQDFRVMFILQKLLELPSDKLQDYLREFDHPRNWIRFCEECATTINQAFQVQKKISELEGKLRKFQREMKDFIGLNFVKNRKKAEGATTKADPLRVTWETWCHVAKKGVHSKPKPVVGQRKAGNNQSSPQFSRSVPRVIRVERIRIPATNYPDRGDDFGMEDNIKSSEPVPTKVSDNDQVGERNQERMVPVPEKVSSTTIAADKRMLDKMWLTKLNFNLKGAYELGGYRCALCPDLNPMSLESFLKHVIFHNDRPYKCSVCHVYLTGSDAELEKLPDLVHNKEGVRENHKCNKETLVPVEFKTGKLLECGYCKVTFNLAEERRIHEKKIHNVRHESSIPLPYDCSRCSSKFRDYTEWRLHRALQHPDLAKLGCFYCYDSFALKTKEGVDVLDILNREHHIKERHGHSAKLNYLYECDFCGENFEASKLLQNHSLREHGVDRPLGCPLCFTRFYCRRVNLRLHTNHIHRVGVTTQTKEKLICDMCAYETKDHLVLREHRLVKHGIEPEEGKRLGPVLTCKEPECSFKTTTKGNLRVHMMKEHNASRSHKCDICGKGFLNGSYLRKHRQIHLNARIKPFQCEICGNSFAVKNYLYIHMRLSHQNRPFASTNKKRPSQNRNLKKRPVKIAKSSSGADINSQVENPEVEKLPPTTVEEPLLPQTPVLVSPAGTICDGTNGQQQDQHISQTN